MLYVGIYLTFKFYVYFGFRSPFHVVIINWVEEKIFEKTSNEFLNS